MKHISYSCIAAFMLLSCQKKSVEPQLPAMTHNGANTFGCKIDGDVFVVIGKYSRVTSNGASAQPSTSFAWYVSGDNGNKSVTLGFDYNSNPHVPGTFSMAGKYPYRGHYFYYPDGTMPTGSTEYITDSVRTGSVTVTDYTSTFASGTFAFDAINGDGKVVHITEGRFDIAF